MYYLFYLCNICTLMFSLLWWVLVTFLMVLERWNNINFAINPFFNPNLNGISMSLFYGVCVCLVCVCLGVKVITHCLKLVKNMLETLQSVRKFTHICSLRKYNLHYRSSLTFADVNMFFPKNQHFVGKMLPLLKAIVW